MGKLVGKQVHLVQVKEILFRVKQLWEDRQIFFKSTKDSDVDQKGK